MSTAHNKASLEDVAKVVLMPGDPLRAKLIAENFLKDAVLFNDVRGMLGYTGTYKGKRVSVMGSGMGMASMGIYSYELFKFYDVDAIIRVGSTGSYSERLPMKSVALVKGSYSESTYALAQSGDTDTMQYPDEDLNKLIESVSQEVSIPVVKTNTHSSDVFYYEGDMEKPEKMIDEMKRQKRELVYKGSILDIYKDTMQFANGKTEEWDFVSHRKGAAAVLPVLDDGRIIMVRQYRNALERETIEIPAGCRDFVGEDTRLCAERELKEETGYSSDDISFLLSLRTTVAFCDEEVDVYLAKNLKKGEQHLDDAESIDVEIYTLKELCDMIYAGKIQDSKTVSAVLAYSNMIK